jgi:hypothetical protein
MRRSVTVKIVEFFVLGNFLLICYCLKYAPYESIFCLDNDSVSYQEIYATRSICVTPLMCEMSFAAPVDALIIMSTCLQHGVAEVSGFHKRFSQKVPFLPSVSLV